MNGLNRLIERLSDAGIEFVIVGGFAAMLHGSTLVTRDLDVCAVLTGDNIAKLRAALHDLNPRHRHTPQKLSFLDDPPHATFKNLYLETELGSVDVLGSILGVGDFQCVLDASMAIELFGRRCRILTLDGLMRAKKALAREKDLLALKELRAIAEQRSRRAE